MAKAKKPLNPNNDPAQVKLRLDKFVEAYLITNNATESAKLAGYSHKTAYAMGHKLLKKVEVQNALVKKAAPVHAKNDVTIERVLHNQGTKAFSNMQDFVKVDAHGRAEISLANLTRDQWAAVKTIKITSAEPMVIVENGQELEREVIKTEITLYDALQANETLMQHLGMMKAILGPPPQVNINLNDMSDLELAKRVAFLLADPSLKGPVIDNEPLKQPQEPETA